jgi:methyltransferase-like protein
LSCVKNIVQQEQYMDFITNRRFRNTILCHKDVKINRNVDSRVIKEFNICSNLHIDKKPSAKDVVSDKKLVFYMPNNKEINVASTSPAAKAALATLFESKGKYLSYKKIIDLSCKKYSGVRKDDIISFIDTTMINLVMSKMLKISLNDFASLGSKKNLKPCELVSYQVRNQSWLTNVRHEKLNVDLPARVIISLMDGKKDKKALIKATIKEVENGTLSLSDDKGKKVTDLKVVEKIVKSSVENVNEKMVNAGVL